MEDTEEKIIERINSTHDCYFLEFEPYEVTSNKNIMLAAIKQNGKNLHYASTELQQDTEFIISAMKQNPDVLNYVDKNPKLWCDILNKTDKYTYEEFPIEIKQNEEIVLYMLIHSKYRCNIRIDESLNKERIIRELISHGISHSDILQIIINGLSESIIKFAINGELIDVPFIVKNNNISVPSSYKKNSCIEIRISNKSGRIDLEAYYNLTPQSFCPRISNDTFFLILDMLSFIYKYQTHLIDTSKKLTTTPSITIRNVDVNTRYRCNLPTNFYALANGSIERGRSKGYDIWSGTFYSQYGFKNDNYNKIIQTYQTILLIDYDKELYTLLNNINEYNNLELNMDTMTLQECAKFIIYLCKTETKMKEMYVSFINKFNDNLDERLVLREEINNKFTKPVSKNRYTIELIDDMVFNITTLSGGKKSKKRKIRKRLTYKY